MTKIVPYEKLSKKEKRKVDAAKRRTWGELNPVTRVPRNSNAYCRKNSRNWLCEDHDACSGNSFYFFNALRITGAISSATAPPISAVKS